MLLKVRREVIVALDTCRQPVPATFRFPHTLYEYNITSESEVAERLQHATIAITDSVPITGETIAKCPSLKLICVAIVGVDHIDLDACRKRGIRVCNSPGATTEAVAEHAIALYFAARRNVVRAHNWIAQGGEWEKDHSGLGPYDRVPLPCTRGTMGIIGSGKIGKRVATIGRILGLKVLSAERRGVAAGDVRAGRTEFETMLRQSTAIILTCPLTEETANTISEKELALMPPGCVVVNVGRGGLINEEAVVSALKEQRLAGYAADVFTNEPANVENSLLLSSKAPNLTLTPHVAWYNSTSLDGMLKAIQDIVEGFIAGSSINVIC
ncbi:hypothetical protein N7468_001512 [Penicillium chermesinum]|uniref:Glycerate dehydrogenase n=1 Tax=Penicillium chermesinum TaxID=63820 RepID=A0A9W9PGP7_9EURO|nr:uncharacterized protein N7468_001512 [Penicillium chermesinum]KAJ5246529.1 hypothetical protein N7468_001512 [Penicillium chermesinum]KAJ6144797.1 hypothetical protein N7470_008692 [Penicillium chermesinum]